MKTILQTDTPAMTVLIVDDHQLFREGMEGLLRKMGIFKDVWHAANGTEAIHMAKLHKPNIIFMDIRMPEMNGIEATRHILVSQPDTKVVALTMIEDTQHIVSMLEAGASGYLLKITNFIELNESVHAVMRGERYFSREISQVLAKMVTDQNSGVKTRGISDEREIIGLVCRGFTSKDIGTLLSISVKTVEKHRANIYQKLGISNIADLACYALQEGIVTRTS
jgi:DNA-binding NarL/FixJ family response regulator